MGSRHLRAASALLAAGAILVAPAEARITRLEITRVEPAFQGRSFAPVGAYERVRGRAFGEVDPDSPNVPPNLTEINAVANPGDGFMLVYYGAGMAVVGLVLIIFSRPSDEPRL